MAAMHPGMLRKILSMDAIVYTGKISYAWYLWHYPFIIFGGGRIPHGALLCVIVSYFAAMASWRFVEKPCLLLKARFEPERKAVQIRASGAMATQPSKVLVLH
jgi:peptidoglycan/LPS O-acetylase OafA/YrhL